MQFPDFGSWGGNLRDEEFAAALAAAGVLAAAKRWPVSTDEEVFAERIYALVEGRDIVAWTEPAFIVVKHVPHTPADLLVSAWRRAVARLRTPFRLKMKVRPEMALWYLRQLSDVRLAISGAFLDLEPSSVYLDWSWPIRVAIMPGEQAGDAERKLREAAAAPWLEPLLSFVDLHQPDPAADFLFFSSGSAIRETLRRAMIPVRANCLVVLDIEPNTWEDVAPAIDEAAALTQAKGVICVPFDARNAELWFPALIREMSHNVALDAALTEVFRYSPNRQPRAMLAASESLIRGTHLHAAAERLSRSIADSTGEVEVDERMSRHLELEPGSHPLPKVSKQLRSTAGRFQYGGESEEATTISRIARAAEGEQKRQPEGESAESANRLLQCRMTDAAGRRVNTLEPGKNRVCTVRVAPPDPDWKQLDRSFPEQDLPPTDSGGHILTVVFSEPVSIPQPLVATIFLPRRGASSECRFPFTVSAEARGFEGRIIVLYGNRVLQTAILRSTQEGNEFFAETMVRPAAALDGRRAYASAILLNHTAEREPQATRIAGYRASLISLRGLDTAILKIKDTWDACEWENEKSWESLAGEDSQKLLRELAYHGRLLYDALVDDQELAERLCTEPRIQVIAARVDAHLPLEFCYSHTPPASNATLCPHAAEALASGQCAACPVSSEDDSVICPLAFWGLSRVIEWHRFNVCDQRAIQNADFALQNEPTPRESTLEPLKCLLLAVSAKIPAAEVKRFGKRLAAVQIAAPQPVASWSKWADGVRQGASILILLTHVEPLHQLMSLEINNELLDPPYINKKHVRADAAGPPLVLLLGCGTGVSDVAYQALPEQFRRRGAAIVVSAMAELLDVHAPRLAAAILEELAKPCAGERRTFGEVMLAVKRQCVGHGLPIAMALQAHGDADWWV